MDGKDAKAMKQTSVRSVGDEKAYASFNQTFPKRLKIIIFLCNYKVVCMPRWWGKQNAGAKPSILWCQISPKYLITIF